MVVLSSYCSIQFGLLQLFFRLLMDIIYILLPGFFEEIGLVIQEAEVMFNFGLAGKYYQERIVRYKNDPECWFDYGVFNLRLNDVQKAEECFKRVVSINQLHMHGILLTGQFRTR